MNKHLPIRRRDVIINPEPDTAAFAKQKAAEIAITKQTIFTHEIGKLQKEYDEVVRQNEKDLLDFIARFEIAKQKNLKEFNEKVMILEKLYGLKMSSANTH